MFSVYFGKWFLAGTVVTVLDLTEVRSQTIRARGVVRS